MQRFDLKRFRLDRKLTQKELAEILMCKQNYNLGCILWLRSMG